jgi:acylphosphatase
MKRVRVVVTGRVQGVWFRASTQEMATRLQLVGWVRNRSDGVVEACFEGNDLDVDRAVAWCHEGPSRARVDGVEVASEPLVGESTFEVR